MLSEEEKEMSTKSKINSLINDIQNKLNKRVPNNYAPYKNIYNQGNSNYITNPSSLLQNNYISQTNPSLVYQQSPFNSSLNEFALRSIIKEEFSSLILPYQKDLILNQKNVDNRLNEVEKKFEIIINAQTMGNLNDNAKIISTYLSTNLSNDNSKKNLEKLKNECDNKFNQLENEVNSVIEQIKVINEEKNKNEENFENFKKIWEKNEKEKNEKEKKEKNKENKIFIEKNLFDSEINKINQKLIDDNNTNEENIQKLNDEINNVSKLINQFKLEINKINGLNNNINSIRGELGKITEDISSLKYQVTPDIIGKINSIDFNKLKQQVSLIEFNKLKNDMNNFDNNFYSVKNITENNERNINDIRIIINDIEQKQNSINKNIEENITEKIKELNNKIEELSKKEKEKEEKKEEVNNNINNNMNEIDKDKKEEEPDLFIGSSRRQQRNNKNINSSVNNNSKNQNNTLDEKSLALIKQLEKINLDELQNMNFNGLLSQIGDLSRENKILSDKIEQQNKTIAEINEKLNKLSLVNIEPKISNVYQKKNIELNEINKTKEKKESFMEEDYDDFDKDFNSDNKNDFKTDLEKEKEKEKESIKPANDINNNINNKNNLIEDSNYRKDILQKSKNEFGSFSKYSEANILDQIMGIGDNNKKPGLGIGFPEQKFGGGSTFITGSLNENNNNKFNFNEKPQIFEEEKIKNENKSKELNNDLNNKKEENNDEDDFDDFDVDEI